MIYVGQQVFDVGEDDGELDGGEAEGLDNEGSAWTDWSFCRPGLTAVAHPSPIAIGRTHGVFVLQPNEPSNHITEFRTCIQVGGITFVCICSMTRVTVVV